MNGYSVQEVANLLGVSSMTIHRMIKRGELRAVMTTGKSGREYFIPEESYQAYKTKRAVQTLEVIREKRELDPLRPIIGALLEEVRTLGEKLEEVRAIGEKLDRIQRENQELRNELRAIRGNTGRYPRIWNGKRK